MNIQLLFLVICNCVLSAYCFSRIAHDLLLLRDESVMFFRVPRGWTPATLRGTYVPITSQVHHICSVAAPAGPARSLSLPRQGRKKCSSPLTK
ncbi:hypothetical protein BDR05DRAFT_960004 [Suillus weaverae]|nr:hypothetical protein BDR05DRAFT_960004 [Suillus weaverae]